jgi:hypothetical protein
LGTIVKTITGVEYLIHGGRMYVRIPLEGWSANVVGIVKGIWDVEEDVAERILLHNWKLVLRFSR